MLMKFCSWFLVFMKEFEVLVNGVMGNSMFVYLRFDLKGLSMMIILVVFSVLVVVVVLVELSIGLVFSSNMVFSVLLFSIWLVFRLLDFGWVFISWVLIVLVVVFR